MAFAELNNFISGMSAHLDIDTHAGEAWVGLRVQLGPAPGPEHKHSSSPPAYHRRQKRRRQSACDRAEPTTAGKVVVDEP